MPGVLKAPPLLFTVRGMVRCDWLSAPELITNSGSNSEFTENVYIKLCEPAELDLNQVGFVWFCQLYTHSETLSLFI